MSITPNNLTAEIELTASQILALHTTPVEIIAKPGQGKAIVVDEVVFHKDAGTAYTDVTTEYFGVRYPSGQLMVDMDVADFLDVTNEEIRVAGPKINYQDIWEPLADTPIEVYLSGQVLTGNASVQMLVNYHLIDLIQ